MECILRTVLEKLDIKSEVHAVSVFSSYFYIE